LSFKDSARFYSIEGRELPSVTSALQIIDKPALVYWSANLERTAMESVLLDVLVLPGATNPEYVLSEVSKRLGGKKAFLKEQDKAQTIGLAAHAWIEWKTKQMLGERVGEEPVIPDGAMVAVEAWKEWAKKVNFTPVCAERVVYDLELGYAGTLDWIGLVNGVMTLGDYKTGKSIYPEAFLQNTAYRHAAGRQGLVTEQGLILRLPKTLKDPTFEAMIVPETDISDFLAALRLWTWQRKIQGKKA
jgi:hypothetical protein